MPRGTSRTAEYVCFLRALERQRTPAERVLDDPYASYFLTPTLARAAKSAAFLAIASLEHPLSLARMLNFVVARHRWMDDALVAALQGDRVAQVVVLGAGYDTRAVRFAAERGDRPIFEVDFPATQARKLTIASAHPELAAPGLHHVPIDFERQALADVLAHTAFERAAPTCFTWEGVTMYLARETVQATLRTLRALGGPGSELVVDLYDAPTGNDLVANAVRVGAGLLRAIGEPIDFALPPAEAPAFFAACGWDVREVAEARALEARYFSRTRRRVLGPVYLVHAVAA